MNKKILTSLTFLLISSLFLYGQQFENLRINQLNNNINIHYDLTGETNGQLFDIQIEASSNGGKNFDLPVKTVKGAIGKELEAGRGQLIVWETLKDVRQLQSDEVVFKLKAIPGKIKMPTDNAHHITANFKGFEKQGAKGHCRLEITNNGDKRDLRFINRLARIYDYNNRRYEAVASKIGNVRGTERYSKPTYTINKGESIMADFYFELPPQMSSRLKLIEFGIEVITITYGLDMVSANLQYRDIPLETEAEQAVQTEMISSPMAFHLGETQPTKDNIPPDVEIMQPATTANKPAQVKREAINLQGIVKDAGGIYEVLVNGMPAKISPSGHFEAEIYLVEGMNTTFVTATDKSGNSAELQHKIFFRPEKKEGQRQTYFSETDDGNELAKMQQEEPGKYYALLIGVNEYADPAIHSLDNPVKDAERLKQTLTKHYTFDEENVFFLKNPGREEIISMMDRINHSISENDNLLVFYAGHGYWDENDQIGYWLPADAKQANTANWLRNSTIRDYLKAIDSRHTILIADACFSGGIFKTRKAFRDAPKSIQKLYEYPSRKAMTSGTLKEVPDQSVFMLYLNKRLEENKRDYIAAEELFSSFKTAVLNNSPNIPQYGEIKDTGDEGGDFIFIRR